MQNPTCINELTKQILAHRDARDWKQFQTPRDGAMAINVEAGELLEWFLWRKGEDLDKYIESNKEKIGEELADVLYCTLLTAADLDIDLADYFHNKMKKNAEKYPADQAKGRPDKYTSYQ